MEGIFETEKGGSEIVLIGQPDMENKKLDNKIAVPNILSFLTYQRWDAEIKGLNDFDESIHSTNVPDYTMVIILWLVWEQFSLKLWYLLFFTLEKQIIPNKMVVVDTDVYDTFSIHRQYCRVVHSRTG